MKQATKRKQLVRNEDGNIYMTEQNLKICNTNQDRYSTPQLNDGFELHYYGFHDIANLQPYSNINTLYLNNNAITTIQNLSPLSKLVTLNLSNNKITKIENLEHLTQLFILDLSGNAIQQITNLHNLSKLASLNISSNLIAKPTSIAQLQANQALTCLNLSNNPLPDDCELYTYLQKIPLLTLFLKDTKFSRGISNYRKQTICRLKHLTFLDERPITKDELILTEAWKQGGLQAEKEARKLIQQSKDQKNKKIYEQMMQRSDKVDKLRDKLFESLTAQQNNQVTALKSRYKQQMLKQNKDEFQLKLIDRKVEELESYLKYFREDVNHMSVAQDREVPNNLCQKHEADAIYIYGVSKQQLPKIKQVYYPDDPRPLIAKDFGKSPESRWVKNYDKMLQQICQEYVSKSEFILPTFNLKVHQFDVEKSRKTRRFKEEQIKGKINKYTKSEAQHEIEKQHEAENQLDRLD